MCTNTPGAAGNCRRGENVDNLLPDLKDILGSVPPDTPVVLFCLDNSCFMGLNEDGNMNPISKCVEGDDGYHVKGALVVAPDRSLRQALEQKKTYNCRMRQPSCLCYLSLAPVRKMPVLQ
jgi:hypothetical protein